MSWPDHLTFGEGDGRLATPDAVARRMEVWRDELGATGLHWRVLRSRIPGTFRAARGYAHPSATAAAAAQWDEMKTVPTLARAAGLQSWLYVSLFDDGYPLAPPSVRAVSYHNAMHGRHVAWQSRLTEQHPDWVTVDRRGRRQWGVVNLLSAGARRAMRDRMLGLLKGTGFDGLFVCLRSQSRPADQADQFGFNPAALRAFKVRHGHAVSRDPAVLQGWRDLLGDGLTQFLVELRCALGSRQLGVGVPRGDILGPPLGNTTLAWRDWMAGGLVDAMVVDQDSSRCPSMWHHLWPMHQGTGYLQDYRTGEGMPPLRRQLQREYGPLAADTHVDLWVARQWHDRAPREESALARIPGVAGMVFSSFRHDNPGAIARGNWRAGRTGATGRPVRPR